MIRVCGAGCINTGGGLHGPGHQDSAAADRQRSPVNGREDHDNEKKSFLPRASFAPANSHPPATTAPWSTDGAPGGEEIRSTGCGNVDPTFPQFTHQIRMASASANSESMFSPVTASRHARRLRRPSWCRTRSRWREFAARRGRPANPQFDLIRTASAGRSRARFGSSKYGPIPRSRFINKVDENAFRPRRQTARDPRTAACNQLWIVKGDRTDPTISRSVRDHANRIFEKPAAASRRAGAESAPFSRPVRHQGSRRAAERRLAGQEKH